MKLIAYLWLVSLMSATVHLGRVMLIPCGRGGFKHRWEPTERKAELRCSICNAWKVTE